MAESLNLDLKKGLEALLSFGQMCPKSPGFTAEKEDHNAPVRALAQARMHFTKYLEAPDAQKQGEMRSILEKVRDVWVSCGNGVNSGKCGNCLETYEKVLDVFEKLSYLKSSYSGDSKLYQIVEKGEQK